MCDECNLITENISSDDWVELTHQAARVKEFCETFPNCDVDIAGISPDAIHIYMCYEKKN